VKVVSSKSFFGQISIEKSNTVYGLVMHNSDDKY
jgi:hypothetical protein